MSSVNKINELTKLRSQVLVYRDVLEMIEFCVKEKINDDANLIADMRHQVLNINDKKIAIRFDELMLMRETIADMCRRVLCADDKEIATRSYGLALLLAAVSEDKFPPVIDEDKHDD